MAPMAAMHNPARDRVGITQLLISPLDIPPIKQITNSTGRTRMSRDFDAPYHIHLDFEAISQLLQQRKSTCTVFAECHSWADHNLARTATFNDSLLKKNGRRG